MPLRGTVRMAFLVSQGVRPPHHSASHNKKTGCAKIAGVTQQELPCTGKQRVERIELLPDGIKIIRSVPQKHEYTHKTSEAINEIEPLSGINFIYQWLRLIG